MSTPDSVPKDSAWEQKRRQILDGAATVFSQQGYAKGTTKQIAAELGLSQPAIYHYVGSKADLLREIAMQVDHDMTEALRRGQAAGGDPAAQLRGIITEFTQAVAANRLTFAVYRAELRSLEPAVAEKIWADEREFIRTVRRVIEQVQAEGKLPSVSASVLTFAILNMVSETNRWFNPSGPLQPSAIADGYCQLIGLGEASSGHSAGYG